MPIYMKLLNKIKDVMLHNAKKYEISQKIKRFCQIEKVQEKTLLKLLFSSKFSIKSSALEIISLHHEDPRLLYLTKKMFCKFFKKYAYLCALEIKQPAIKIELIKQIPMIYRMMAR